MINMHLKEKIKRKSEKKINFKDCFTDDTERAKYICECDSFQSLRTMTEKVLSPHQKRGRNKKMEEKG